MTKQASARIYRGTERNLRFLARKLQEGELVAVPSETVYGLAGNALDARACRRIFAAKGRPSNDPLIVHVHSLTQLEQVAVPNAAAIKLARKFWPGPLTLVLPKRDSVPDEATSGLPSVAVRMPGHPLFRKLLDYCGLPLAAPSANPFGYVSPTTSAHVAEHLGRKIRYILEGGAAPIGLESTIVDLRDARHPRILRPGAVTRQQLERALGRRIDRQSGTKASQGDSPQIAPGLLKKHYSPKARVILHRKLPSFRASRMSADEAWLFLKKPAHPMDHRIHWLDPKGQLSGAARALFAKLRELDAAGFATIHVELASGSGLAEAINDRLFRAAAK